MSNNSDLSVFKATIAHQPHERFLYYAAYVEAAEEALKKYTSLESVDEIAKHYGAFRPWDVSMSVPGYLEPTDFSRYFADITIPDGSTINGYGLLEVPHGFYHFTEYISPLRNATTLAEIKDFPYPMHEGFAECGMAKAVVQAHTENRVACTWVGHIYETAWQIRGYEEFLMDMLACPEIPEYILDVITEGNLVRAEAAARAGVDYITTGDDVANQRAMMFSVEKWRHFMKPRWGRVMAAARAIKPDIQIWYHSDGNIEEIIPDLIEIGVTILNPVQPECLDIPKIKCEYGKDLVFDGIIGTQTTMPFGKPDDVRQSVRQAKRDYGYDGALIISPTHVLEPEVSVENIVAFFEECRR